MAKQTANNGGSQAAGSKPVTFSRQAAQRIAKAVRTVEGGNRNQPGITFDHSQPGGTKTFRMATFTGSWAINTPKVLLPLNVTATTATFSAFNVLFDISLLSDTTNTPTTCAVGKYGTAWHLINVVHTDADVLTSVTLQPTRLEFGRNRLASINTTIATTAISITECDNAAASAEQLNWFFG